MNVTCPVAPPSSGWTRPRCRRGRAGALPGLCSGVFRGRARTPRRRLRWPPRRRRRVRDTASRPRGTGSVAPAPAPSLRRLRASVAQPRRHPSSAHRCSACAAIAAPQSLRRRHQLLPRLRPRRSSCALRRAATRCGRPRARQLGPRWHRRPCLGAAADGATAVPAECAGSPGRGPQPPPAMRPAPPPAPPPAAPAAPPAAPRVPAPAPPPLRRLLPPRQRPPVRPGAPRPVNPFLSQDPGQKARRLARALISDLVVYHPGSPQGRPRVTGTSRSCSRKRSRRAGRSTPTRWARRWPTRRRTSTTR